MRARDAIRRPGISVDGSTTIQEAAAAMERGGVGALAVMDHDQLAGIVTDRDLVCRGVAKGVPPDARVDALMSTPAVTLDAGADLRDAIPLFAEHALRRLPVIDGDEFVGVISIDDLLVNLSSDLAALCRPITAEVLFGHHEPSVPAAT
jgi:CBS domain-containing protein